MTMTITPQRKRTQRDRVEFALKVARNGVCARWFVYDTKPGIPRVAARVHELRQDGYDIETERCDLHLHDGSAVHDKYRMLFS